MKNQLSSLWTRMPTDLAARLEACVDSAHGWGGDGKHTYVFFRADDIAVPGKHFFTLMDQFARNRIPLSLAVVPSWITPARWKVLREVAGRDRSLWCWHQHGWRHVNHSPDEKKSEFGNDRSEQDIESDLTKGLHKLEAVLGDQFYPAFTPPWNRCGTKALRSLANLGFKAVSASPGCFKKRQEGIAEFSINVDLHTRKESSSEQAWKNLLKELEKAISGGICGIMIHHQRMNGAAFDFLEYLFKALTLRRGMYIVHLKDLAQSYPQGAPS